VLHRRFPPKNWSCITAENTVCVNRRLKLRSKVTVLAPVRLNEIVSLTSVSAPTLKE
jgi:hypothetical protein